MPQKYDTSFVREGRTLAQWLPDLVSPDVDARRNAGDALLAMMFGVPSAQAHDELVGSPPPEIIKSPGSSLSARHLPRPVFHRATSLRQWSIA